MLALLAQLAPRPRDPDANAERAARVLRDRPDVDLAVFPELYLGGYTLRALDELALTPGAGPLATVAAAAAAARTAVVIGFAERLDDGVANSAACFDADGSLAGIYRKTHLFGREAEAFTAGVLEAMPALTAITAPSVASYQRLQPHRWSGPWACWGRENREAALRFVTGMVGSRKQNANLEVKAMDGAANPYLALGAVVAAGIDGLERELALPDEVLDDPASLSATKRKALGIRQLPSSLGEAIVELERSRVIREAMGDVLFEAFLATRNAERDAYEGKDPETVVAAHRWRY